LKYIASEREANLQHVLSFTHVHCRIKRHLRAGGAVLVQRGHSREAAGETFLAAQASVIALCLEHPSITMACSKHQLYVTVLTVAGVAPQLVDIIYSRKSVHLSDESSAGTVTLTLLAPSFRQ
jgi:hypothetical protein